MRKCVFLCLLGLAMLPVASEAAPIYVVGSECPVDSTPAPKKQYYVTPSLRCVFDLESNNLQGTSTEADKYLNSELADTAGWGTAALTDNWVGLRQDDGDGEDIIGFDFTADDGNDDGTFTIGGPLTSTYNQFALAVKNGSEPFWAIFELGVNQKTGNWGFSTDKGDLSHFALYGRNTLAINEECPDGRCDSDIPQVPEPATLLLLGSGLTLAARRRRAKR